MPAEVTQAAAQRSGSAGNTTGVARSEGPIGQTRTQQNQGPALQRSNAGSKSKNPRDLTGRQKQALEAELAEQQEEAAEQMMVQARTNRSRRAQPVDYTKGGVSQIDQAVGHKPGLSDDPVYAEAKYVEIYVNSDIEQMTHGRQVLSQGDPENGVPPTMGGLQFYDFSEGTPYLVTRSMALWLDDIGYIAAWRELTPSEIASLED